MQFEWRVSVGHDPADNVLAYSEVENAHKFMAATADQIFSQEVMLAFLHRLRTWAGETLGVAHASSPQVQVYVKGCWRSIMRDDVRAKWHYLFSLTPQSRGCGTETNPVKILSEPPSKGKLRSLISFGRITTAQLEFNQLLVHEAGKPYGIEENLKCSERPFEGSVFLDGYLW